MCIRDRIYVTGILTGTTYLTVTDNATQETCTLPIKVVDNYENMELLRSYLSNLPNGDANLLPGISDIFLINNHARDAYFFKQGEQTAFSSGLELITQGSYKLEKEEGDDKKMTLTLTFSEDKMCIRDSFIYLQLDEEGYKKQEVTIGADNGKSVQILTGVKAGDRVVTEGAYQVRLASASNAIPAHSHEH